VESEESGVFRYIKQLTDTKNMTERMAKAFYKHFTSSESTVVGIYEEVVTIHSRQ
jgi:hypothetical protein